MAPVQRSVINGKALVQYLHKDLVIDGVESRAEVKEDDSADVTGVYRLDDLVIVSCVPFSSYMTLKIS